MGIESDIQELKRTVAMLKRQADKRPATKTRSKSKLSAKQARQRTANILHAIGGRTVTVDQLGNIADKYRMVRSATGALYAGGYVRKSSDGKITLTQKGKAFKV